MMTTNKPLGIYLHIPFCVEKCKYCDFLSFGGSKNDRHSDYTDALIKEIKYYGEVYRNKYYVDTIFIGGGTPSLIDEALTARIMNAVRANFNVDKDAEITIESNPKTLTKSKLYSYLKMGINRLSIGAQSLDDNLLESLGRIHTAEDFINNYIMARECGFKNINIDLMFSIPGQTISVWKDTFNKVLALEPEHISFYSLQFEEGTPFYKMLSEGILEETNDEIDREMYDVALKLSSDMDYNHYEISNASKNGFSCKHNLKYWSLNDYLGLGIGSHSYMNGMRFSNTREMEKYIKASKAIDDGIEGYIRKSGFKEGSGPFTEWKHKNSRQDDMSEYIFTGMRKIEGISLAEFENRFGQEMEQLYGTEIEGFIKNGLVEIEDGKLRLTRRGIDISNSVFVAFL